MTHYIISQYNIAHYTMTCDTIQGNIISSPNKSSRSWISCSTFAFLKVVFLSMMPPWVKTYKHITNKAPTGYGKTCPQDALPSLAKPRTIPSSSCAMNMITIVIIPRSDLKHRSQTNAQEPFTNRSRTNNLNTTHTCVHEPFTNKVFLPNTV